MNYQQAVEFIQSFPDSERGLPGAKSARGMNMPLSNMKELLQAMGNPQNTCKVIHIAGSKGKGSTATFIASILKQAGIHTALFTSPHLHSYTERIAFDLQPVSEETFAKVVSAIQPYIDSLDGQNKIVSTFGILTALYFSLVAKNEPLWQVVEVGLGGKYDLTNVFDQKEIAVITPISLEHTAILGSTKGEIAENKAGIITPGCTVVLAPQNDPAVVNVIQRMCEEKGAELVKLAKDHKLPYPIQLLGEHQIDNAMTAIAVIDTLVKRGRISISEEAIGDGLAQAFIPGRFEIIKEAIVLDGAHNGDSAAALAKALHQVFPERDVVFILGVNEDKDLEAIWQELKDIPGATIATRSGNNRSLSPEEIYNRIKACDAAAEIVWTNNIDEALQEASVLANSILLQSKIKSAKDKPVICVCGSLYLVAEARERLLKVGGMYL